MDTDLIEIINGLIDHFKKFKIDFFIVGAKARDILEKMLASKKVQGKQQMWILRY